MVVLAVSVRDVFPFLSYYCCIIHRTNNRSGIFSNIFGLRPNLNPGFVNQNFKTQCFFHFSTFRAISTPDFQNPNHQAAVDAESDPYLHRPYAARPLTCDAPRLENSLATSPMHHGRQVNLEISTPGGPDRDAAVCRNTCTSRGLK